MSSKRKQEEKHLQVLKGIQQVQCNKKCFECDQRGPTYVDVTIGSLVCTTCGGILRGLNPPHRVKSISMATFTPTEIAFIQTRGNEYCKNIYLGRYDERSKAKPESRNDHTKLKFFMEQKYEQKKWYVSPEQAEKPLESFLDAAKAAKANEIKPLTTLLGPNHAQIKIEKKEPEKTKDPMPKQQSLDIFGDFSGGFNTSTASPPASSSSGFADFSNAFSTTSNNTFDAFGDFTSGQSGAITTNPPGFGADFTNIMSAGSTTSTAPPVAKPVDKYSDLGDLFSMDNIATPAKPDTGNMWTQSSGSMFGQQPTSAGSVFESHASPSQGSVFGTQSATSTQSSLFGSSPMSNTQSQPQSFVNPSQSYTQFAVSQSTPAFGNMQQQQPTSAYPIQQQNNFNGTPQASTFLQPTNFSQQNSYPQAASSYGTTHTVNSFGAQQQFASMQKFGVPTQQNAFASTNSSMTFPTQTPAASNPFFMQTPAASAQPAIGANPFMSHQQPPNQPQSATNPFMNLASQQANTVPTNPFF